MKTYRLPNWLTVPLTIFLSILATVQGACDLHPPTYCTNEKCRIAADEILGSQNQSINPCNDFYEHVCTGQKGYHFYYTNVKVHEEITELFKNIQPSDMEALKKSKTFHDACMDRDAIERRGLTPIERILSDNGEWPMIVPSDKWNDQTVGWQVIHENFAKRTGISALFDATVEIDRNNTGGHVLSLSVPTIPSQRSHLIPQMNEKSLSYNRYKKYLAAVGVQLKKLKGFDVKRDDLRTDVKEIIEFEDKLDKFATLFDEDGNENADDVWVTTIEGLQKDWDAVVPSNSDYSINWLDTINGRFEGTGIVIDASEKILLKPASFISNFTSVLVNTPVRTIVNYIHWKVVDNLVPFTFPKLRNLYNPYATSGMIAANAAGACINLNKMTHAVAYMYVKGQFSLQSRKAALEMVRNMQDEIKREISGSSWLDEATKSVARRKIEAMTNLVGYPEWYDEPGKIDEYYRELTVGPDYFENNVAYNKFEAKKKLSKLRSPVDISETEWELAMPHVVNAEYRELSNAMSLPAAILRSPFFVYERPLVLNYGSIGSIVGHEIGHGFDTKGRLYDEAGIKRKWWSQSMIDKYKTKAQCFVKQYDNYTAIDENKKTVHLNGTETQRENIADTMGFRAGLRAYQRLRNAGKTNNVKIERLSKFTDEQLYFYQLAYVWCFPGETYTKSSSDGMNSHSPARSRIIGALSNMQEFADAFHSPPGSPMNPPEKYLIWD